MGTTNLFVELVVIGVGAAVWILELVLACFGFGWTQHDFSSSLVTIVATALVYILGIVTDRVADGLFEGFLSAKMRHRVYGAAVAEYYRDRRLLLMRSAAEISLFEYGRSRMRICRGWTVNSLLITVATNVLIWSNFAGTRTSSAIQSVAPVASCSLREDVFIPGLSSKPRSSLRPGRARNFRRAPEWQNVWRKSECLTELC